ncbi:MAG: right-handed parallel beta-helix repeat-containing protein [Chitinophagales bacterium]
MKNLLYSSTKYLLIICFALLSSLVAYSQGVVWEQNYGGSNIDYLHYMIPTSGNNFILVGQTSSNDNDVDGSNGGTDMWVAEIDIDGNIQWDKNYGGNLFDVGRSLSITSDGGYIIAGYSTSSNLDVVGNYGQQDFWVVKIDANGIIDWNQNYGGSDQDFAYNILSTSDGGYIIGGLSESSDNDVNSNYGNRDFWVVKIDSNGNIQWDKNYGGSDVDECLSMASTTDGGYILSGFTMSNDNDVDLNYGGKDFWVVKIDANGNIQWDKNYGGSGDDTAESIIQTVDGGYIIGGNTNSVTDDVDANNGNTDFWVVKTDSNGNIQWEQNYGGTGRDIVNSVALSSNGGYIIIGRSESSNGDVGGNYGSSDVWLLNIDANGNIDWEQNYGGSDYEEGGTILPISEGYIYGGYSESIDNDVSGNYGNFDMWLFSIYAPLGGTYTVGPSPSSDFINLQHAMDSLSQVGMYKQVTLEVEAGITLDEQVHITDYVGLTATDSLTINGNGATLTNSLATCTNPAIIQIDGADHVIINGLNIEASPVATGAWGIHLKNQADSVYIRNCTIDVGVNETSTCYMGIVASNSDNSINAPDHYGNNANRTVIHNNNIRGGHTGIAILGNSDKSMKGPVIQDNVIEDSYDTGILLGYLTNFLVKENIINLIIDRVSPNLNPDNTGIQLRYAESQLEVFEYGIYAGESQLEVAQYSVPGIEGNELYNISGQGIYIEDSGQNPADSANDPPYIVNNTVSGNFGGTMPSAGIVFENGDSWWVYHNSVNAEGNGDGIYIDAASSDVDVQNNTFTTDGGMGFPAHIENESSINTWDYNNYFSPNAGIVNIGGAIFNDIPSLPDNDHSVSINPIFIAFNNLHILDITQQTNAADPAIAALFPLDIDGEPRPDGTTQLPDMGADEILPLVILEETLCYTVGDSIHLSIPDTLNNPQWIDVVNMTYSLVSYEEDLDTLAFAVTPTYIGVGNTTNATYAVIYTIHTSDAMADNNSPVCEGEDVQLTGSTTVSGSSMPTYQWSGPDNYSSSTQDPLLSTVELADAGEYILKVTIDGCLSKGDTTVVSISEQPDATAEVDQGAACIGKDMTLNALTTSSATDITYQWSGPNTFSSTEQSPTLTNVAVGDSGNYTVVITAEGCVSDPATVSVTVLSVPNASASNTGSPACTGDDITLNSSTSTGGSTIGYVWSGPNNFTSTNQNPILTDATTIQSGTYAVTITVDGCTSDPSTTDITINAVPLATATNDSPACMGADVQLNSNTSTTGTTVAYQWSGPNSFSSTEQNPIVSNADAASTGDYSVTITVDDCVSQGRQLSPSMECNRQCRCVPITVDGCI